jgi:anthranilate synthase component II
MRLLIVDNHDSFTYNLVQIVERAGCRDFTIIANDRADCDANAFDKVIFSPGPGVPVEEAGIMKHILARYAANKGILGVCLGHQAIAEFFGARLANLSRAYHGVKARIALVDSSDYLFAGLPGEIDGGLYHSWAVSDVGLPACLRVTAISAEGTIMGLSHRAYNIKGLQFHPESIMTEYGTAILGNWLSSPRKPP